MSSSTLKKLNECKQLSFLKLKDLEQGKKYQMTKMDVITTKFGECVVVQLNEFPNLLILPKRFQKLISEIENINKDIKTKKVFLSTENVDNFLNVKFE